MNWRSYGVVSESVENWVGTEAGYYYIFGVGKVSTGTVCNFNLVLSCCYALDISWDNTNRKQQQVVTKKHLTQNGVRNRQRLAARHWYFKSLLQLEGFPFGLM